MKERPILFSGPMVRANLNTKPDVWPAEPIDATKPYKSMTRRVIKQFPVSGYRWGGWIFEGSCKEDNGKATIVPESNLAYMAQGQIKARCPYGQPGDRLWVRETWAHEVNAQAANSEEEGPFVYAADGKDSAMRRIDSKWRPSIFMPRWASRITLEIVSIRVERVQDIYHNTQDAISEGVECLGEFEAASMCDIPARRKTCWKWYGNTMKQMLDSPLESFISLWETINLKRGYGWDANPWVWIVEFRRIGKEA